jgi:hypothetical protein
MTRQLPFEFFAISRTKNHRDHSEANDKEEEDQNGAVSHFVKRLVGLQF